MGYKFLNREGDFEAERADMVNGLYFPIADAEGLKSAFTPDLGGDAKLDQNHFLLEPVSVENLHNNRSVRNFWCRTKEGAWSAVGASDEEHARRFKPEADHTRVRAGFMWHEISRTSWAYGLTSDIISFIPLHSGTEVMYVTITCDSQEEVSFTPTAAIPMYGRSAANIRDHRHVTSLLHRIRLVKDGIYLRPTLSFDERGHLVNDTTYFTCGVTGEGEAPVSFFPTVEDFIGDGGSLTNPYSIYADAEGTSAEVYAGGVKTENMQDGTIQKGAPQDYIDLQGKEALGGLRFAPVTLQPGESARFIILTGAVKNEDDIEKLLDRLSTPEKVETELAQTKKYWQSRVNVAYHTGSEDYDSFLRWVSFQPVLRRIYGCSFLPHHDYGRGGRGWRDLWQDCLALLLMDPSGVREMILSNFDGVRLDGTNATIIGERRGEFIADRNNITRVWMDHGVWPLITTRLYIDQSGDAAILGEEAGYFKDRQVCRGTQSDEAWLPEQGSRQRAAGGEEYRGTVLEHLLLQNLCAFYEVGEHNIIRLRGADWNDALDMAEQRGESVAFTFAYAGNLKSLADLVLLYGEKTGACSVQLPEEAEILLQGCDLDAPAAKQTLLQVYCSSVRHTCSGRKKSFGLESLARNLRQKADWLMNHLQRQEWVSDGESGWFNSYYDNNGRPVEGVSAGKVHMMLTGQVFAVMSGTADTRQIREITKSADKYLYDAAAGGYRLNTDFGCMRTDLGRMFGFAYGEKENGAVFSHMTVMYANALYSRGFAREGYKALQTLTDKAMDFDTAKIYPGIPEYFNNRGQGLYHYLTGAASWYMLTMITQAFGVRGQAGDLLIRPQLCREQFNENGQAGLSCMFAGREIEVTLRNPENLDACEYRISEVRLNGSVLSVTDVAGRYMRIDRKNLTDAPAGAVKMEVLLGKKAI